MIADNPQPTLKVLPRDGFTRLALPPQLLQRCKGVGPGQLLHVFQKGQPVRRLDTFVREVARERSRLGGDGFGAGQEVGRGCPCAERFLSPDDFIEYVLQTFPGDKESGPGRTFDRESFQPSDRFAVCRIEIHVSGNHLRRSG